MKAVGNGSIGSSLKNRPTEPNPIQEALHNYQSMQQQVRVTEDSIRHLKQMNTDMMRENAFLKDQYEKADNDRKKLQAYAVELTTRLSVISDAISAAVSQSSQFAIEKVMEEANELEQNTLLRDT